MSNVIQNRLCQLRDAMKHHDVDAYVILSSDPHMSEYLPEFWQTRQWISGFTGSVGTVVVTQDFAGLWVDGRYWIQAEQQLAGTGMVLQKLTGANTSHMVWLNQHMPKYSVLAIDADILAYSQFKQLEKSLKNQSITLKTDMDLIHAIWQDRPALPKAAIYAVKPEYPVKTRAEQLALIRQYMAEKGVTHHFVSSLDDIAWITQFRGNDVDFNPVFLSHLLLDNEQAILFVASGKLSEALEDALLKDGISTQAYDATIAELTRLPESAQVLLDASKVSLAHVAAIGAESCVFDINPSTLLKSRKSPAEIQHIQDVMVQDGVALCQFFNAFEAAMAQGEPMTELTVDERLTACRQKRPDYISLSFPTIAGFNDNGALPHYCATQESYADIDGNGLLLIDSGAQYEGGTTDITRVIPIGQITDAHKQDFTRVLKAHIALASVVFPEGIAAPLLDVIARQHLWSAQLDYRHGTGHGVGYFLNVHEGPQSISYSAPMTPYNKMYAGMVTSNEPGLYREGQWGIRIENLLATVALPKTEDAEGVYLHFEDLTLCPIDTRCVDKSMMTASEILWLNQYHERVYLALSPYLSGSDLAWLIKRTEKIG